MTRFLIGALLCACGTPPEPPEAAARRFSSALLGPSSRFAVLGGSSLACAGPSSISGDIGVSPGEDLTAFNAASILTTPLRADDAITALAHNHLVGVSRELANLACEHPLTGELGGRQLAPGVYCFDSDAMLTGQLTLDAGRNASALWIFQVKGALATAAGASVVMAGAGQPCSVFWQVGGSATLEEDTAFLGNLVVSEDITFARGASLRGRALSLHGAVALDGNAISGTCVVPGRAPCIPRDWVTGQGWLKVAPSSEKHSFSLRAGIHRDAFEGRLLYQRQGPNPVQVISQRITGYTVLDATARRVEGTATVNGKPDLTWQVDVREDRAPGHHDTFSLRLSNGYAAEGALRGGEIQLHDDRGPRGQCVVAEVDPSTGLDAQDHGPDGLCTRHHEH
jgi:hypothetical protein